MVQAISQHKRMAMGEKVSGMKRGGAVHDDSAEDRRIIKGMVKPAALMKDGGKCSKCGMKHGGRC